MLITLFWIMVAVTLLAWSLPMLSLPRNVMARCRLPVGDPPLVARLLGTACLGLATMYGFGLVRAYRGDDVTDIVAIGLVSNSLAAAIIWRYALEGSFDGWTPFTRSLVYASGALLSALAIALMAVALLSVGIWHGI